MLNSIITKEKKKYLKSILKSKKLMQNESAKL